MESDSQTLTHSQPPVPYDICEEKVEEVVNYTLSILGLQDWLVSTSFVSESEIKELNKEYRSKDHPTDVLSFPQEIFDDPVTVKKPLLEQAKTDEHAPPKVLGDIVICVAIADQNAQKIGQSLDKEIAFLIVHSVLHLCGHDHKNQSEEDIMLESQRTIIAKMEDDEPPPVWNNCVRSST